MREKRERPSAVLLGLDVSEGPGKARIGKASPGKASPGDDPSDDQDDDEEERDESDDEREQEEDDAAQMLIDALEGKDPRAVVSAFRALKAACEDY